MKKNGSIKILLCALICLASVFLLPEWARAQEDGWIEGFTVSIGRKGFCPGKNNYLRIKSYVNPTGAASEIRLRIYNAKGKCVFETVDAGMRGGFFDYKWNGKPSARNEARVSSGRFVKNGRYRVEVAVLSKETGGLLAEKSRECKVSSRAPSGRRGLADAVTPPILTGDAQVDYMAEQICKAAKIKSSMRADEKVRRIYHWMTVNQKHAHYGEGGTFRTYFNLSSSGKKIRSYRKSTDLLCRNGGLIYNHDANLIRRSWCMERRVGECTDNAAIFKILCNHVGVEAGICSGFYLNRNGTKPPHSWNYAIVEGSVYYYDVDVEIQNYGKGQGDYYWYRKSKAEADRTHQFVNID